MDYQEKQNRISNLYEEIREIKEDMDRASKTDNEISMLKIQVNDLQLLVASLVDKVESPETLLKLVLLNELEKKLK